MQISEFIDEDLIKTELESETKEEVLKELTTLLTRKYPELKEDEIVNLLIEREKLGSTGIGNGVAIPHGKLKDGNHIYIAFGVSKKGIDFDAIDGKPVHIFALLLAPESQPAKHLQALAKISRILKKEEIRQKLLNSGSSEEFLKVIEEEDKKL